MPTVRRAMVRYDLVAEDLFECVERPVERIDLAGEGVARPERVQQQDEQRAEVDHDQPERAARPAAARAAVAAGRGARPPAVGAASRLRAGAVAAASVVIGQEMRLPGGGPPGSIGFRTGAHRRPVSRRGAWSRPRPRRRSPRRSSQSSSSAQSSRAVLQYQTSSQYASSVAWVCSQCPAYSAVLERLGVVTGLLAGGRLAELDRGLRVGLGRHHVVHPQVHAVRMRRLGGDHPGVGPPGRTLRPA